LYKNGKSKEFIANVVYNKNVVLPQFYPDIRYTYLTSTIVSEYLSGFGKEDKMHSTLNDVLCAYAPTALVIARIAETVVRFYFSKK